MSLNAKQQRRRYRQSNGLALIRQPQMANHVRVVLPYRDYYSASITSGGSPALYVRTNSTFAPIDSGWVRAGQPRARDQWANFFSSYIVHRVKIEVTAGIAPLQSGANPDPAVLMDHYVSNSNASIVGDGNPGMECSRVPFQGTMLTSGGTSQTISTGWIELASLEGRTPAEYRADDSQYGAAIGASPVATSYHVTLFSVPTLAGLATNVLTAVLTVHYDVEFYNPVQLGAS
jgi:hypothetical protein